MKMSDDSAAQSRPSEEGHKQIEEWAQAGNNNEASDSKWNELIT